MRLKVRVVLFSSVGPDRERVPDGHALAMPCLVGDRRSALLVVSGQHVLRIDDGRHLERIPEVTRQEVMTRAGVVIAAADDLGVVCAGIGGVSEEAVGRGGDGDEFEKFLRGRIELGSGDDIVRQRLVGARIHEFGAEGGEISFALGGGGNGGGRVAGRRAQFCRLPGTEEEQPVR